MPATERQHPDRGWWVKFDRAQDHLRDLLRLTKPYTKPRWHRVTDEVESKGRKTEWVYRVWFDAPDQAWCAYAGDFLFNLTAALDHLAVALNPHKRQNDLIYFPIYQDDPWLRREGTRCYVDNNPTNRTRFSESTRHMRPEAVDLIKKSQPYATAKVTGNDAADNTLALLKRFHLVDKHRRLLALRGGCPGGTLTWTHNGKTFTETYAIPADRMAGDGAAIIGLRYKVDMKFVGPLGVAFARSEPKQTKLGLGPFLGLDRLPRLSATVEDRLLALEPYVQW